MRIKAGAGLERRKGANLSAGKCVRGDVRANGKVVLGDFRVRAMWDGLGE